MTCHWLHCKHQVIWVAISIIQTRVLRDIISFYRCDIELISHVCRGVWWYFWLQLQKLECNLWEYICIKIRLLVTEMFIDNEQGWIPVKSSPRIAGHRLVEFDFIVFEIVNLNTTEFYFRGVSIFGLKNLERKFEKKLTEFHFQQQKFDCWKEQQWFLGRPVSNPLFLTISHFWTLLVRP